MLQTRGQWAQELNRESVVGKPFLRTILGSKDLPQILWFEPPGFSPLFLREHAQNINRGQNDRGKFFFRPQLEPFYLQLSLFAYSPLRCFLDTFPL